MDQNSQNHVGVQPRNAGARVYSAIVLIFDLIVIYAQWTYFVLEGIYQLFKPPEEKSVVGEIVLITGTGHGIGRELALQYSALGATVVCWDINEAGNKETVKEIEARNGKARAYVCDVSSREQIIDVAKKVKAEVGTVTILVNNAGIMPCHPFLQHTEAEIRKIFDINVLAHFWMMQAFLPDMIAKHHGHIVSLSSMAGVVGLQNLVPYCGSKFAVRGLTEAINEEIRMQGIVEQIKFTTIYPYMVDTGLCKKPYMRFKNLMKLIRPDEAAAAIISAQRQGLIEASIPKYLLYLNGFTRLFPVKCGVLLKDFFNSGVHSDLTE
ncbi:short-chain dehydrogenase/reductase family 16C member 6 [Lutzomyia longipalpis]|uniref:short-chain dehydrogenase/reductase family 16C member 6 n=1 Tax=Lutzomyia longipalpis TaxID=7200 RepID=UPI0024834021|nr:short-chain dehydrogenase/reductase family 16C member 6 [Lutzomyia longipalpis]